MSLGSRRVSTFFCAACGADVHVQPGGVPRRARIAKDRALVIVCADCDPTDDTRLPPATIGGRGYESPSFDPAQQAQKIHRIAEGMETTHAYSKQRNSGQARDDAKRERTEGWILVRVSRRHGFNEGRGRWLDHAEAAETLRAEPWFDELRYIGTTSTHVIFERPPEGVTDYAISTNPLAWRRIVHGEDS